MKQRYEIEYSNKKFKGGFIGINAEANNSLHLLSNFARKHPEHIIKVFKNQPKSVRLHTIRHEEAEEWKIKQLRRKGYSWKRAYHEAHYHFALPFEKLNKPFPKTNVKQRLIKMGFKKHL